MTQTARFMCNFHKEQVAFFPFSSCRVCSKKKDITSLISCRDDAWACVFGDYVTMQPMHNSPLISNSVQLPRGDLMGYDLTLSLNVINSIHSAPAFKGAVTLIFYTKMFKEIIFRLYFLVKHNAH